MGKTLTMHIYASRDVPLSCGELSDAINRNLITLRQDPAVQPVLDELARLGVWCPELVDVTDDSALISTDYAAEREMHKQWNAWRRIGSPANHQPAPAPPWCALPPDYSRPLGTTFWVRSSDARVRLDRFEPYDESTHCDDDGQPLWEDPWHYVDGLREKVEGRSDFADFPFDAVYERGIAWEIDLTWHVDSPMTRHLLVGIAAASLSELTSGVIDYIEEARNRINPDENEEDIAGYPALPEPFLLWFPGWLLADYGRRKELRGY